MLGFGLSIEPQLWALIFVMIRVGTAFVAAPVFGAVAIPVTVRVTLAGAIGLLVLAAHPIVPPAQVFGVSTILSVGSEALVGLALGFVLQIAFAAPLVASEVIGGSMGLGFANTIDPLNGHASPALGQFLSVLLTLLFLSVDGHLVLVDTIVKSYDAMPPGQAWLTADKLKGIAFFGGYAFLAGLLLALPVGFLLLCLNLAVGMLSRSAPALNLFAVGLPVSLAVGVIALATAFPVMGDYMLVVVREGLAAVSHLVIGWMADEFGDKTEAPTQKRKREAVEQGDVLRSKEFGTALVVLAGVAWLMFAGPSLIAGLKAVLTAAFSFDHGDVEDFEPWRPLLQAGGQLLPSLGTLFAVGVGAAIMSQAGLGHLGFNGGLLAPKWSRVDPAAGLKRILGIQGWLELGKSILKVVLLGAIGWYTLSAASHRMMGLAASDVSVAIHELGGELSGVLIAMASGLVLIAMLDVPVQLVRLLGKLRMTKQQIKDEHKESEGSPEAKQHIRAKQRAILSRSARKAVGEAHVVLTNPTHFAVALRYDRLADQVPVVVAKGRGATATAIRELAGELGTPLLEYPSLARAVYYTSREGQEVRDDLYMAIATVLAFVFGLNEAAGGTNPPDVAVPPSARFDENGVRQGLS